MHAERTTHRIASAVDVPAVHCWRFPDALYRLHHVLSGYRSQIRRMDSSSDSSVLGHSPRQSAVCVSFPCLTSVDGNMNTSDGALVISLRRQALVNMPRRHVQRGRIKRLLWNDNLVGCLCLARQCVAVAFRVLRVRVLIVPDAITIRVFPLLPGVREHILCVQYAVTIALFVSIVADVICVAVSPFMWIVWESIVDIVHAVVVMVGLGMKCGS